MTLRTTLKTVILSFSSAHIHIHSHTRTKVKILYFCFAFGIMRRINSWRHSPDSVFILFCLFHFLYGRSSPFHSLPQRYAAAAPRFFCPTKRHMFSIFVTSYTRNIKSARASFVPKRYSYVSFRFFRFISFIFASVLFLY